jgi:hypothetical protein
MGEGEEGVFGEGAEGFGFVVDVFAMVFEVLLEDVFEVAGPVLDGGGVAVGFDLVEQAQEEGFVAVRLEGDAAFIQPAREVKAKLAFDEVLILQKLVAGIGVKLVADGGEEVGDDVDREMLFGPF